MVSRREFFVRARTEFSSVDGYAAAEIALVGISLLGILFHPFSREKTRILFRNSIGTYIVFLLYAMATGVLSINPAYSIFFSLECLSQIALIFIVLASSRNSQDLAKKIIVGGVCVTLINFALIVSLTGIRFDILAYKSNGAGACAASLAIFCVFYHFDTPSIGLTRLTRFGAAVGIAVLILTTSAGSIISFCFGFALALALIGKTKIPFFTFALFVFFVATFFPQDAFQILFPGKEVAQVETLHGRFTIWESSTTTLTESPIFGVGYAMAAKVGQLRGNFHNSILSILVGNGILGCLIVGVAFFRVTKEFLYLWKQNTPLIVPMFAAFCTLLLNSNTLSFFGEGWRAAGFAMFQLWAGISITYHFTTSQTKSELIK